MFRLWAGKHLNQSDFWNPGNIIAALKLYDLLNIILIALMENARLHEHELMNEDETYDINHLHLLWLHQFDCSTGSTSSWYIYPENIYMYIVYDISLFDKPFGLLEHIK